MLVSIVVPVYNSTKSVEDIARGVAEVLTALNDEYELILVDDSSPNPETWPTLRLIAGEAAVVAIQLTRNFGQKGTTLCGLSAARGDVVVTMDDDLQHDPHDIPNLLAAADHDIVIAQFPARRHSWFKRLTSRIKGYFDQLLIGKPRHIRMTSFRLMRRIVIDAMLRTRTPYPFIPALLFHFSKDVVGVAVPHHPRQVGDSGYTLRELVRVYSNLIINNSSFLLRLVGYLGMGVAVVAFLAVPVVVYRRVFLDVQTQGWSSLLVLVLMTSGLLLFSVGLIRIIETTESKPPYIVRHAICRPGPTCAGDSRPQGAP